MSKLLYVIKNYDTDEYNKILEDKLSGWKGELCVFYGLVKMRMIDSSQVGPQA